MDRELVCLNMIREIIDDAKSELGIDDIYHRIRSGDMADDVLPIWLIHKIRESISWGLGVTSHQEFLASQLEDLILAAELWEDG